jgi:hypothetical protein
MHTTQLIFNYGVKKNLSESINIIKRMKRALMMVDRNFRFKVGIRIVIVLIDGQRDTLMRVLYQSTSMQRVLGFGDLTQRADGLLIMMPHPYDRIHKSMIDRKNYSSMKMVMQQEKGVEMFNRGYHESK